MSLFMAFVLFLGQVTPAMAAPVPPEIEKDYQEFMRQEQQELVAYDQFLQKSAADLAGLFTAYSVVTHDEKGQRLRLIPQNVDSKFYQELQEHLGHLVQYVQDNDAFGIVSQMSMIRTIQQMLATVVGMPILGFSVYAIAKFFGYHVDASMAASTTIATSAAFISFMTILLSLNQDFRSDEVLTKFVQQKGVNVLKYSHTLERFFIYFLREMQRQGFRLADPKMEARVATAYLWHRQRIESQLNTIGMAFRDFVKNQVVPENEPQGSGRANRKLFRHIHQALVRADKAQSSQEFCRIFLQRQP